MGTPAFPPPSSVNKHHPQPPKQKMQGDGAGVSSASWSRKMQKAEASTIFPAPIPEAEPAIKPPLSRNVPRRRREQAKKRAFREQHGRCALPRVRKKISTMVSAESFPFSVSNSLVEGLQLGGYQPLSGKQMEKEMGEMVKRMRSAYDRTLDTPAEDVLGDLKGMGYRVASWDGELMPAPSVQR